MSNYDSYLDSSLDCMKQYISEMKSRPILFVGSGFSRRYINTPNWLGLLERLINENPEIDLPIDYFLQEHDNNYAVIASILVDSYFNFAWKDKSSQGEQFPPTLFTSASTKSIYLKYRIATIIKELMDSFELESNEWLEEILLIKKLNPQAIITTNYDTLLEELFPKYSTIVGQKVIFAKKSTDIGHILKIHGSVDECSSIIIEKQDYDNFYTNQIYLIAKLFTYFMEHPIIFIGYSLNDENIKSILYNVKKILNPDAEPLIPNMWFIDWSRESINPDSILPREIPISVGNGESVRLNYIKLNTYEKLYDSLFQDSVDIEILKQIEETVYNVVKSDTITNLEVDIASLRYLTDRESFLNSLTSTSQEVNQSRPLMTFATINDPNVTVKYF
jgi:hypothetical protein